MRVNFTQKVFAFLKMYAFVTLFLGITFLVYAFPNYPKSVSQWAWFLLLVAPVSLAIEFLGHFMWNNRANRAVERKTERKSFSFLRIGYAIVFVSLIFVGLWCLGWAAGSVFKAYF